MELWVIWSCLDYVVPGNSRLICCVMQLYLFFDNHVFVATLYISLGVAVYFTNPFRLSNPYGDAEHAVVGSTTTIFSVSLVPRPFSSIFLYPVPISVPRLRLLLIFSNSTWRWPLRSLSVPQRVPGDAQPHRNNADLSAVRRWSGHLRDCYAGRVC